MSRVAMVLLVVAKQKEGQHGEAYSCVSFGFEFFIMDIALLLLTFFTTIGLCTDSS